jgi:ABC-type sugar transport system ATPase subunit
MAKVTFKNVSKRFEKVIAVDNVNFHINDVSFSLFWPFRLR